MLARFAALLSVLASVAAADTLQGRVLEDHSNNPLASVEIRVSRVGNRQLAAELETDANGHFAAEGLPAGEYRIEASKPNYTGATLRVSKLPGSLVIRLVRCAVISGQVLDAQGKAIRGATIYAIPKAAGGGPLRPYTGPGHVARVNDRGQYRLYDLVPGDYALAMTYGASTATFGSSGGATVRPELGSGVMFYPTNARPQVFSIAGGEEFRNTDFTVVPTTLYQVSGQLELPDPKTEFWLSLTTEDQSVLATAVAETNKDGSFRFEGIPPGSYALSASGPIGGYGGKGIIGVDPYFGRTQVTVGGSNVEGVAIPVHKGRSLSFILRSSEPQSPWGACPATATLTLTALEDWATRLDQTAEINFKEQKTVEHLGPAHFQVGVQGLGESCYQPELAIIDLASAKFEEPVSVMVAPAGSIRGKLIGTNEPANFAVALVPADATNGEQAVQVTFPDTEGRFAFGSLRPGRYRLAAQPAGENSKARWVADRTRMLEIQIAAGAPTALELPAPPPIKQ